MQVKKEPDTEPLVDETKPVEADSALTGEDKLSTAVPEDVSLNTPVSNSEEIAASTEPTAETGETSTTTPTAETSNGITDAPAAQEEGKTPEESKNEGVTDDSVSNSLAAKEEGGDLEGSVTAEDPPNPYDSDDDVVDDEVVDEPAADEADDDLMSQVPPPLPAASSSQENMESAEAAEVASPVSPAAPAAESTMDSTPAEPDSESTAEAAEAPVSSLEPMDTSVSNSDDKSEQDSRTEIVNGQNLDSHHRSAEEDLLTSTTNMEEGDEQYKNIIAESQMDNIFN